MLVNSIFLNFLANFWIVLVVTSFLLRYLVQFCVKFLFYLFSRQISKFLVFPQNFAQNKGGNWAPTFPLFPTMIVNRSKMYHHMCIIFKGDIVFFTVLSISIKQLNQLVPEVRTSVVSIQIAPTTLWLATYVTFQRLPWSKLSHCTIG